MVPRVLEVEPLAGYKLRLKFGDGATGTIDLSDQLWGTMFEPLKDEQLFRQAAVHPELETVTWPNGADLAPEYLYQNAIKESATVDI